MLSLENIFQVESVPLSSILQMLMCMEKNNMWVDYVNNVKEKYWVNKGSVLKRGVLGKKYNCVVSTETLHWQQDSHTGCGMQGRTSRSEAELWLYTYSVLSALPFASTATLHLHGHTKLGCVCQTCHNGCLSVSKKKTTWRTPCIFFLLPMTPL